MELLHSTALRMSIPVAELLVAVVELCVSPGVVCAASAKCYSVSGDQTAAAEYYSVSGDKTAAAECYSVDGDEPAAAECYFVFGDTTAEACSCCVVSVGIKGHAEC